MPAHATGCASGDAYRDRRIRRGDDLGRSASDASCRGREHGRRAPHRLPGDNPSRWRATPRSAQHRSVDRQRLRQLSGQSSQVHDRHSGPRRRGELVCADELLRCADTARSEPNLAGDQSPAQRDRAPHAGGRRRLLGQAGDADGRQRHTRHLLPGPGTRHRPTFVRVSAGASRRPHPVPGRRRDQAIPEPGGDPHVRVEKFRGGGQRQGLPAADPAVPRRQHHVQQHRHLDCRSRRQLPAEGRRRFQTDPPATESTPGQPLGNRRTSVGDNRTQLRPPGDPADVQCTQRLAPGCRRLAGARPRNRGVQSGGGLCARPLRAEPVPPGPGDVQQQYGADGLPGRSRSRLSRKRLAADGRICGCAARGRIRQSHLRRWSRSPPARAARRDTS